MTDILSFSQAYAAASSDSIVKLFDKSTLRCLRELPRIPAGPALKSIAKTNGSEEGLITTYEDGSVHMYDLRSDVSSSRLTLRGAQVCNGRRRPSGSADLLVRCQGRTMLLAYVQPQAVAIHTWPAGPSSFTTKLLYEYSKLNKYTAGAETEISFDLSSDLRSTSEPLHTYLEAHSDDVSTLAFHPTEDHLLLSGAMDGLSSIIDVRIADEDDAILYTANVGASLSKVGWTSLPGKQAWQGTFALTNMETLSLYDAADEVCVPLVRYKACSYANPLDVARQGPRRCARDRKLGLADSLRYRLHKHRYWSSAHGWPTGVSRTTSIPGFCYP